MALPELYVQADYIAPTHRRTAHLAPATTWFPKVLPSQLLAETKQTTIPSLSRLPRTAHLAPATTWFPKVLPSQLLAETKQTTIPRLSRLPGLPVACLQSMFVSYIFIAP